MDEQLYLLGLGLSRKDKIAKAIDLLREYEAQAIKMDPVNGYHLAFSGGKDSVVLKALADLARVKYGAVYLNTTIEPPELYRFVRDRHPDVYIHQPYRSLLSLVASYKGPPTRRFRWCCSVYKEESAKHKIKLLGVRAEKSPRRALKWKTFTPIKTARQDCIALNPILYWSDQDVWAFIKDQRIEYCSLYDECFDRLGCIGCPMAGAKRVEEFERWPGYGRAWRRAIDTWWKDHVGTKTKTGNDHQASKFRDSEHAWQHWMDNTEPWDPDQCQFPLF